MPKYTGTVSDCIDQMVHHVAPHKAGLMAAAYGGGEVIPVDVIATRNAMLMAELVALSGQIEKIRAAAKKGDAARVSKIMDEQFEYGSDD